MTSHFRSMKSILSFSITAHIAVLFFIGISAGQKETFKSSPTFNLAFGTPKKFGTPGVAKQVLKKDVVTKGPALKSKSAVSPESQEIVAAPQAATGPIGNGGSPDGVGNSNGNGGSPDGVNSPQARYNSLLSSIINKHKHYPRMAKALHHEGRVVVQVTLDKEGNLINIEILEKASFETLTKAAMETIRNVGKFPPLPVELGKEQLTFKVPVDYKITL